MISHASTTTLSLIGCMQGKLTPRAAGAAVADADVALLDSLHQQPSDAGAPFAGVPAQPRPPTPPRSRSAPLKPPLANRPATVLSRPASGVSAGAAAPVHGEADDTLRSKSSAAASAAAHGRRAFDDSAADRLAHFSRSNSSAGTSTAGGRPQTRGAFEASAAKWSQRGVLSPGAEGSEQVFTDFAGVPLRAEYFRSTPAGASQGCCTIM